MSASGPSIYPGEFPSWAVFKFPPDSAPAPLPPPYNGEPTFANPFPIPTDIYQGALSYKVPLTIASVYAVVVTFLNWYNRQHGNKAWRIAKTRPFFAFVIFHNVFLAVYSAVTCVAMFRGLQRSFPHYSEPNAFVGTVDALCKIHGPRGLGDAVTYHPDAHEWGSRNANITLGAEGLPDSTDVGRIWNEGLAFWGWWFYLSKFYEVLDTAIILAKGKRSTTLQKYHHAGAMLCMWAGMRFMSPPIWMFVLVNSGIHAMMYTYYTLSALGFRVPNVVKRTLTSMQIMQFLVGSAYAALHLFVSYTVPVAIPYQVAEKIAPITSVVTSTVSSTVSSITTSTPEVIPTATGAALHFLRKLIYRAAGEEGLAENIPFPGVPTPIQRGHLAPPHPEHPIEHFFHQEHRNRTVYRTEYQHVPCIDTSGQAFAVYLNLIYLAPLTGLFMRFFVKSYLRRTSPNTKSSKHPIAKASRDATRGVERELASLDESPDGVTTGVDKPKDVVRGRKPLSNGGVKDSRVSLSPDNQRFVQNVNRKVSERLQEMDQSVENVGKKAKDIAKDITDKAQDTKVKAEQQWEQGSKVLGETKDNIEQELENGQKKAGEIKNEVADQAQDLKEEAEKQSSNVANKANEMKDHVEGESQNVKEEAGEQAQNIKEEAGEQAQNIKEEAGKQAQNANEEAGKQSQNLQNEAGQLPKKGKKKLQESRIPSPRKKMKDGKNDVEERSQSAGDKPLDQSIKADSSSMVIVEKEPEPKDLNNTLGKGEGRGKF